MLMEEMIRTCSNPAIAAAAVASLGRTVRSDVGRAAARRDLAIGEYAAGAVARFTRSGEREMRSVARVMQHSQEPILAGLQMLLTFAIAAEAAAKPDEALAPPTVVAAEDICREREWLG